MFKVGDRVKWKADFRSAEIEKHKVYTIKSISPKGRLDFVGMPSRGWYPENFELDKNTIIYNIIQEL